MSPSSVRQAARAVLAFSLPFFSVAAGAAAATEEIIPRIVVAADASSATLTVPSGEVVLKPCSDRVTRLDVRPNGESSPRTPIIRDGACPDRPGSVTLLHSGVSVRSGDLSLVMTSSPPSLQALDREGGLLYVVSFQTLEPVQFRFPRGTPIYGAIGIPKPGLTVDGSIQIAAGFNGGAGSPIAWSTTGWGALWDADGGVATVDEQHLVIRQPTKKNTELFLLAGKPAEIFRGIGEVSGFPPLIPRWSLGLMHFEWGMLQKELYRDLATYRAKGIPLDVIAIDYEWFNQGVDDWGDFRWNDRNYPDGASGELSRDLLDRGIKLIVMRKPWLDPNTVQGREAHARGWLYRSANGEPTKEFDFSDPAARAWWWDHTKPILDTGVAGYWNDEADGFDNFRFLQMQRTHYEGQRALHDRRVWSLNRNFYLGSQRYGYANWTGDIESTDETLAGQRSMMLRSIHLGSIWWGMDVGGFKGRVWWLHPPSFEGLPSDETYARWVQFGAFVPVFRLHGRHNLEREPWRFGRRAERAVIPFIKLRYRLIPYLYSYARQATTRYLAITRSMPVSFPNDPTVREMASQWMVGEHILVRPVVERGATSVPVYLPAGEWIDYFTGERLSGPKSVDRRIDAVGWSDIPLYIRSGAIIPTVPDGPLSITPRPQAPLVIEVYPAPDESIFELYDDDGETYRYERGDFSVHAIRTKENPDGRLEVSVRRTEGAFPLHYRSLVFRLHPRSSRPIARVLLNGRALPGQGGGAVSEPSWRIEREHELDVVAVHAQAEDSVDIVVEPERVLQ